MLCLLKGASIIGILIKGCFYIKTLLLSGVSIFVGMKGDYYRECLLWGYIMGVSIIGDVFNRMCLC